MDSVTQSIILVLVWSIMAFIVYPWLAQKRLKRTLEDEEFMSAAMEKVGEKLAPKVAPQIGRLLGMDYGRIKANIMKNVDNGGANMEDADLGGVDLPISSLMGLQAFQGLVKKNPALAMGTQILMENPPILEYLLEMARGMTGSPQGKTPRSPGGFGLQKR